MEPSGERKGEFWAVKPDITLLFVRHPEHNLASLKKKFYAGVAGTLDEKFKVLEDAYKRRSELFDEVFRGKQTYLVRRRREARVHLRHGRQAGRGPTPA